jgi:hypothetical protein
MGFKFPMKTVTNALFVRLVSHQPAVLFSQNKSATSNQPTVLFSQNKPAPAISHQPNEQAARQSANIYFTYFLRIFYNQCDELMTFAKPYIYIL